MRASHRYLVFGAMVIVIMTVAYSISEMGKM